MRPGLLQQVLLCVLEIMNGDFSRPGLRRSLCPCESVLSSLQPMLLTARGSLSSPTLISPFPVLSLPPVCSHGSSGQGHTLPFKEGSHTSPGAGKRGKLQVLQGLSSPIPAFPAARPLCRWEKSGRERLGVKGWV